MTNIVNLTPHTIVVIRDSGNVVIPASGQVARVSVSSVQDGDIDGIPVFVSKFGDVDGLPAPQDGTVFLVSTLVAGRVKDRDDIFVPNDFVRDSDGRIIGCRSLGRL